MKRLICFLKNIPIKVFRGWFVLRPVPMTRIEVVAPVDKVDKIVMDIGNIGVAHFIDVAKTKEKKYRGVAEEVRRIERENFLLQLSNRINNLIKKLENVPYPNPIPIEEDPKKVLKEIEEKVASLEVEYAKIENMVKELSEEKASLERDVRQLYDEYENVKRFLVENKVDLSILPDIPFKALEVKNSIRSFHEDLVEIQRSLAFIDTAGKMASSYMSIPNDKKEIEKIDEDLEKTLALNQTVKRDVPEATEEIGKIEAILNEIKEVIRRKVEAIEKVEELKSKISQVKEKVEKIEKELTGEIVNLLGEEFSSNLKQALNITEEIEVLSLGSPKVEKLIGKISNLVYGIRRGFEVLESVEKYLALDSVRRLVEEVRGGDVESIKTIFEESKTLLAKLPLRHLETIERAFNILAMENRIQELTKEPMELKEKVVEIAKKADYIHAYNEIVEIELKIENLYKKFRQTGKTCVFEVWVRKSDVEKAVNTIREACPTAVVNIEEKEEAEDKPPTKMENPKISWPFEKLVAAYGLPNYHELDPTIITLITFPIIFGFMFGDVGHGLILLIGGLLLNKIWDKFNLKGEIWDPIRQGRNLIVACGVTATFFGFMYGELFGPTNYEYIRHAIEHGAIVPPAWYSQLTGLEGPVWFSPTENLIYFFEIALFVGMVHLTFGIVLDLVNKVRLKEYREAIAPASWLWFYGSLIYLLLLVMSPGLPIIPNGKTPAEVIGSVFKPPAENLILMFFIVPFVGMLVLHKFAVGDFMEAFSETVTKTIESLSNTFSYARILALGVTHALFSELGLMGTGNPAMFWVVLVMVTLFMIIALEGMLTFAHTLRLHWVEWFSKFYKGDGIPFEGFTIKRRFTVVSKV